MSADDWYAPVDRLDDAEREHAEERGIMEIAEEIMLLAQRIDALREGRDTGAIDSALAELRA